MKEANNIETLPTNIIIILMGLVLVGGFESGFNFFVAWARTQRPPVILSLLEGLPVRDMYKFGNKGGDEGKSCFDRFMQIGENLGVADAIMYQKCRGILRGFGNIDVHFTGIDGLASAGHFGAMVANFILRTLYKQESSTNTLQALVPIFHHPQYKNAIGQVLIDLGHIYAAAGCPEVSTEACLGVACPIHSTNMVLMNQQLGEMDCFFCTTNTMLNVFSSGGCM